MNKSVFIVLVFLLWQCISPKPYAVQQTLYIYDNKLLLDVWTMNDSAWKSIVYETDIYMPEYSDSILISNNRKIYGFEYFLSYEGYSDTSFIKNKTYLDSITYLDSEWLSVEQNLDSLWFPVDCWRCGGIYDTAEIYLVLPIENTDSIVFRQVHRIFHQTR